MRQLDTDAVQAQALRVVARVAPAHSTLFRETLARVSPQRWALEWHLPWWLGNAFGLRLHIAFDLSVSNVIGLVALRLHDNLTDNQIPQSQRATARASARQLQTVALDCYRPYFDKADSFWETVTQQLNAWHAASRAVNALTPFAIQRLRASNSPNARVIANLGAPLKINVHAICRLTAQHKALTSLEKLLDHALIAAVLHDHAVDWEPDLDEGRPNFFVGAVSPYAQHRRNRQANRARVIQAFCGNERARAYFQEISFHLEHARLTSQALHIAPLETHLCCFAKQVCELYDARQKTYHANIEDASRLLFGALYEPATEKSARKENLRKKVSYPHRETRITV